MAIGTLASRGTGFLRILVIAAATGRIIGDAYNAANTIPNIVYELLLGGVLTSVVVPLLVSAARRDGDEGEAYAQRLLTVVIIGLGAASLLAVLLAPAIIHLYVGNAHAATARQATTFARFFLPQILFYGVGALLGAILNVRGSFAPPMWAPVTNNIVAIVTGLVFIAVTQTAAVRSGVLTGAQEVLLAAGTTLGIIAQTVVLLPALRKVRFRFRLRSDLRGVGLARAGGLAGWVFVYVLANQIAYLFITRFAFGAHGHSGDYTAYTYAFFLVLLPHSVVAVSVITALLPQMSRNAAQGRLAAVGDDLASGLKVTSVILVPAALAAMVLGPLIGTVVFGYHAFTASDGRLVGATLAAYAVSLVPFSAFQLQLRAFYAFHDTRTPALVNLALATLNVGADVFLLAVLPSRDRVIGLALGYSLSYVVGFAWFSVLLRTRLGTPPRAHVTRTLVRLSVAGGLGAAVAYVVAHLVTAVAGKGTAGSLLGLLAGAAAGGPVYLFAILHMRVPEVHQVRQLAMARVGATAGPADEGSR
ncbi:MAG: hypothetical protein NVSMB32_09110 [Actinomycetota bacterium]